MKNINFLGKDTKDTAGQHPALRGGAQHCGLRGLPVAAVHRHRPDPRLLDVRLVSLQGSFEGFFYFLKF